MIILLRSLYDRLTSEDSVRWGTPAGPYAEKGERVLCGARADATSSPAPGSN